MTFKCVFMLSASCITTRTGTEYMGNASSTSTGKRCTQWADTYNGHYIDPIVIPDGSWHMAKNQCRKISDWSHPQCPTGFVNVAPCSIDYCRKWMIFILYCTFNKLNKCIQLWISWQHFNNRNADTKHQAFSKRV